MRMFRSGHAPLLFFIALSLVLAAVCGCGSGEGESVQRSEFVLATTTSVQDSGILDGFVSRFEKENPYRVKAVAVGSGAALFMGMNGDATVILTHEPVAEKEFEDGGYAESQSKVMHNDFIIVGPKDDPAGIKGMEDPVEAFRRIAEKQCTFVSRGDASGTHAMETSIWERAGIQPQGDWYVESGQGMGICLRMAQEKEAYTLTDRATFIVLQEALGMDTMVEGDPSLLNQYTVSVINPEKFPGIELDGARAFAEFLQSEQTKKYIETFGWDEYHQHLFYPD
jgi:tungstate transport system substrate-binding protein